MKCVIITNCQKMFIANVTNILKTQTIFYITQQTKNKNYGIINLCKNVKR
jgi:hypothetical protein